MVYDRSRSKPRFPMLRAFGWVLTLPVAFVLGLVVAVASGSNAWGVGSGACTALVGLGFVALGYLLAEALSRYLPALAFASTVPVTALTWAVSSGMAWLWAIAWMFATWMLIGISRGIVLHANNRYGSLLSDIVRGFQPRV